MAKCLVADDSKIIRMLLSKIMNNLGFDVVEAEDGEEVVRQWKKTPLDLIVTFHIRSYLKTGTETKP